MDEEVGLKKYIALLYLTISRHCVISMRAQDKVYLSLGSLDCDPLIDYPQALPRAINTENVI